MLYKTNILLTLLIISYLFDRSYSYWLSNAKIIRNQFKLLEKDVTVNNLDTNESITIKEGSPLSLAAVRSNIRLSFQCKQGVCQSCEVLLNGQVVRACITKVPSMSKITLKKIKKF